MRFVKDSSEYLEQQEVFTGEMTARILEHLEGAGIKGAKLKELTGNIAFEVASMLDSASEIKFDGTVVNPYLTFQSNENNDEIIHLGGSSYCHELVYGILHALCKDET